MTRQRLDVEIGRRIAVLFALGLHRALGFADAEHYARERLGMSGRKARALVAIERKAGQVPELLQAYRSGRLSWLAALTVLGVAGLRDWRGLGRSRGRGDTQAPGARGRPDQLGAPAVPLFWSRTRSIRAARGEPTMTE